MRVLAIESSCDESAVAVLDETQGLLAHELFSQIDLHRVYGGVVPELASATTCAGCRGCSVRPWTRPGAGSRPSTPWPTRPARASSARC